MRMDLIGVHAAPLSPPARTWVTYDSANAVNLWKSNPKSNFFWLEELKIGFV